MAVKRSQRMQLIVDLAQREHERHGRMVQDAQQRLHQEQNKQVELQGYYDSYAEMFSCSNRSFRAQEIAQNRDLLLRLSQAIASQKQQISRAEMTLADARQTWQKSHLKLHSLADLVAQYQHEEAADSDRKEQKMIDDWVSVSRANREGR